MGHVGYRNLLIQYIDNRDFDQPILTTQIVKYVTEQTGLNEEDVKKAVNVNMARLEKTDYVVRVEKGVYCKKIKTAFGYYTPDRESLFCKQLLYDADGVIGYETGLSVLNRIGLVSQMPRRKCIATNLYTKRIPAGVQVEIRKPAVNINSANHHYLQMLDAIQDFEKAPVDTAKPEEVLRGMAMTLRLNTDMLILLARRYYSQRILIKTIDIMLGDIYGAAQG